LPCLIDEFGSLPRPVGSSLGVLRVPPPARRHPDWCADPRSAPRSAPTGRRPRRRPGSPAPTASPSAGRAHPGSARARRTPRSRRGDPHPTRGPGRHTRLRPAGPDHAAGPQDRPPGTAPHYDPGVLAEPAEIRLHDTLGKTRAAVEGTTDLDHYTGATTDLTHAVAEFFNQVYVMDDNPERRAARLGLLAAIAELGEQTLAWEHLHA
jgi:DALR anticodon binding protein